MYVVINTETLLTYIWQPTRASLFHTTLPLQVTVALFAETDVTALVVENNEACWLLLAYKRNFLKVWGLVRTEVCTVSINFLKKKITA